MDGPVQQGGYFIENEAHANQGAADSEVSRVHVPLLVVDVVLSKYYTP